MARTEDEALAPGWMLAAGIYLLARAISVFLGAVFSGPPFLAPVWRAFGMVWMALGAVMLLVLSAGAFACAIEIAQCKRAFRWRDAGIGLLCPVVTAGVMAFGAGRLVEGLWQRVLYGSGLLVGAGVAFAAWIGLRRECEPLGPIRREGRIFPQGAPAGSDDIGKPGHLQV